MPVMTIVRAAQEAGQEAGVNVETIRFYERQGLIERPPKGEGYRVYSPDEIARVRFIKEAQHVGFPLGEIKELLALRADPAVDCTVVQQQAIAKREEVRRKIERLQEIEATLDMLIATCPGHGGLLSVVIFCFLSWARCGCRGLSQTFPNQCASCVCTASGF